MFSNPCESGQPWPLGATLRDGGVNFAIFSSVAEKVELCLFDADGGAEVARISLPCRSDNIWHGFVPGLAAGALYGVRVHGPYDPDSGPRCNPAKLLIDPYARALDRPLRGAAWQYAYGLESGKRDLKPNPEDNAQHAARCVVVDPAFDWGDDRPPATALARSVFYEVHVKGFTQQLEAVPEQLRGTFAGLASDAAIAHLKRIGVTAVELLPVQAFNDDRRLVDLGLGNYWGYNTIGFFAPDARYCAQPGIAEFKQMVKALHAAGIQDHLDAGGVHRLDHAAELVEVVAGLVARVRREEADGVVAPVVGETEIHQPAFVVEGLHRQQFDRRHAQRLQVRDGGLGGQAGEGAAQFLRHVHHLLREAARMHFVEDTVFHRRGRVAVIAPVESRIDHHALGGRRRVVARVHVQVALFLAERITVLPGRAKEGPIELPGIRVDQQLVGIAAPAVQRLVRAMHAQPVARPGSQARNESVPDVVGAGGERDATFFTLAAGVEQADLHPLGSAGIDREVDAAVTEGGAQRPGRARLAAGGPGRFGHGTADGLVGGIGADGLRRHARTSIRVDAPTICADSAWSGLA